MLMSRIQTHFASNLAFILVDFVFLGEYNISYYKVLISVKKTIIIDTFIVLTIKKKDWQEDKTRGKVVRE